MDILKNYINGAWVNSRENTTIDVINPATQEVMGKVPFGSKTAEDLGLAVEAAETAFKSWSQVPVMQRVQPLYKLKYLLEENLEDLAKTITMECGKTLTESRGELQRAIENVEVACGMPVMMQSEFSENIAGGIDEFMIRQP
ncbi:MAG: aldehyde dehydrogenase family protein, partial [Cyclobacteriaceae bacterium]|nr:aldehyde dehydrogenase family protein [Cyclobacteriaceae bacterium]